MKFDDERSSNEDDSEEKNTLWENPDVHLTKYPEPFGDTDDEMSMNSLTPLRQLFITTEWVLQTRLKY